jgi:hypothetical protein
MADNVVPSSGLDEAIASLETALLEQLREQLRDLGPVHKAVRESLIALIDNELARRAGRLQ